MKTRDIDSLFFFFVSISDISVHFNRQEKYIMHQKFCLIDAHWDDEFVSEYKKALRALKRSESQFNDSASASIKYNEAIKNVLSVKSDNQMISGHCGILITGSMNWTKQVNI